MDKGGREPEYDLFRAWLIAKYTEARYWIDHRDESAYQLMAREAKKYFDAKNAE